MNANPYEAPLPQPTVQHNAAAGVLAPALLLLLLSAVTLLFESYVAFTVVVDTIRFVEHWGFGEGLLRAAPFAVGFCLVFAAHAAEFVGAIAMYRCRGLVRAKIASILSIVPLLSPGYLCGIPIGIWALVALRKPGVKEAFHLNAT